MGTTANRGYTYPASTDNTQIWTHIQNLATGVDTDVQTVVNAQTTRIATTVITSDSTTWGTTETEAATVTGTLVSGQKYSITFSGRISSDVSADSDNIRIREDTVSGTQLGGVQVYLATNSANGYFAHLYVEYTAVASASKTFSFTGQRSIGTGTAHRIRGGGTTPNYLRIDKVMS